MLFSEIATFCTVKDRNVLYCKCNKKITYNKPVRRKGKEMNIYKFKLYILYINIYILLWFDCILVCFCVCFFLFFVSEVKSNWLWVLQWGHFQTLNYLFTIAKVYKTWSSTQACSKYFVLWHMSRHCRDHTLNTASIDAGKLQEFT